MGHRVEVNFLRLLASCERLVLEDKTKRSPETRKKLQKFVGVLEQQLAALQGGDAEGAAGWLPRTVATEYTKRLAEVTHYAHHQTRGSQQNELRARLFDLHSTSSSPRLTEAPLDERSTDGSEDGPPAHVLTSDRYGTDKSDEGEHNELRYRGQSRANEVEDEDQVVGRKFQRGDAFIPTREESRKRSADSMSRSESDIGNQYDAEVEQHNITEDMLDIVGRLKNNSLSLNAILKDDASRLDELEVHTDNNLHRIKNENQSLQRQLKSSSSNTLWFWIIIIFVGLVFVWMVIFIKLFPKH